MFKSNKKLDQEPSQRAFTLDALASHLDASHRDVNDKLATFFNELTLKTISESVLGQKPLQLEGPKFTARPSTEFCKQTNAYKKYVEFLQVAQVELSHFSIESYHGKITVAFSVADDFFEKAQPTALLDAPKADALGDEPTQSVIVTASQKKQPAII